jgi:hypothetical protein
MQTMYPYPVPSSRGAFRRRSQGEERERHLRAGETQPPTPGGTRAASPATMSRPGPTTVKGIKAKMPRWRAARRGCTAVHHGPAAAGHRLVASQAQRLVGAPTPSFGAKRIDRNEGAPWPKAHEQGTISHVHASCYPSKTPFAAGAQSWLLSPALPSPPCHDERPLQ